MSGWQLLPWGAFAEFTADWDRLNQRLYQAHPLLDSRFVAALLKHFAQPCTYLAIYQITGEPISNLLILEPTKLGLWRTFLPSQAQIAPVLCSEPAALSQLPAALPGFTLAIDILCQDPLFSFAQTTVPYLDVFAHVTTINIEITRSFTDYWQQRSRKLQQNIRRYFNRLSKNGSTYKLNIITTPNELELALQRYGVLESKSWKGASGTAIHRDNLQGLFYTDVLQTFASNRQAEIVELCFNDQLVASRINVLNTQMLVTLKTSYDEDLAKMAPGRLLLYLLIEREFNLQRLMQIEFYTNATNDQKTWATDSRTIQQLTLYRGMIEKKLTYIYRSVKKIIQSNPIQSNLSK